MSEPRGALSNVARDGLDRHLQQVDNVATGCIRSYQRVRTGYLEISGSGVTSVRPPMSA